MAADHSLRGRGRARGVQVAERVAILDVGDRLGVGRARGQPVERRLEDLERGSPEERGELRLDDRGARPAVLDDVRDLGRAPEQVDRDADRAELRAGVVRLEELEAVAGDEQDRVAAAVATPGERVGEAVHLGVELGVGEAPLALDDGLLLRQAPGCARERVSEVDAADQVGVQRPLVHQYDLGRPSDAWAT